MGRPLFIAVVLLAVAAVAYKLLRGGLGDAKFVITVNGEGTDGIELQGDVPGHGAGDVVDFVAEQQLPAGAKIWGVPDGDGIRLQFSNEIPENIKQRVRNFFGLAR